MFVHGIGRCFAMKMDRRARMMIRRQPSMCYGQVSHETSLVELANLYMYMFRDRPAASYLQPLTQKKAHPRARDRSLPFHEGHSRSRDNSLFDSSCRA